MVGTVTADFRWNSENAASLCWPEPPPARSGCQPVEVDGAWAAFAGGRVLAW